MIFFQLKRKSQNCRSVYILILVCCFSFLDVANANSVREMSLSQKVNNSDLVIIGKIASISKKCRIRMNKCAIIHVMVRLKGKSSGGNPQIIFDGMVAELDPECCEINSKYIFFLVRIRDNIYRSVNGPYGVYLIK